MTRPASFSALVVLARALASGRAEDETARVRAAFSALGFTVGPCVGDAFSIDGAADDFQGVFGVRLRTRSGGGVMCDGAPPRPQGLSLQKLPPSLRPLVAAVVFEEPPAFGPGELP